MQPISEGIPKLALLLLKYLGGAVSRSVHRRASEVADLHVTAFAGNKLGLVFRHISDLHRGGIILRKNPSLKRAPCTEGGDSGSVDQ